MGEGKKENGGGWRGTGDRQMVNTEANTPPQNGRQGGRYQNPPGASCLRGVGMKLDASVGHARTSAQEHLRERESAARVKYCRGDTVRDKANRRFQSSFECPCLATWLTVLRSQSFPSAEPPEGASTKTIAETSLSKSSGIGSIRIEELMR